MTARITKARLALLMDTAKEKGGRVKLNLATGEAEVDFAAPANEHDDPAAADAERAEALMDSTMGSAKR